MKNAAWLWALLACVGAGRGQEPVFTADGKAVLSFSATWDVGMGRDVFVVGNHPDLGEWNPAAGRKLRWTPGNAWSGAVAVAEGSAIEYKFVARTNSGAAFCAAGNVEWAAGANLSTSAPLRAGAPFAGKTVFYFSGWTNAALLHRSGGDVDWSDAPMQRVGEGRFPGEHLYRADGVGRGGETLIFVPHGFAAGDPAEKWDNCPISWTQDYVTRLDAFVLQDGQIYNYWPSASGSASAIATHFVASDFGPAAPSRNVRVYVPRNYAQNPAKRYPVLYLHDGQNVFRPGGIYGCWNAETAADEMIALGMMSETILVAIDNTGERTREYIPPTDAPDGPGAADRYLAYVANNVMPFVNATYRTLAGPEHTGVLGSSFGGVASLYFGTATNLFGKIGPMSTSFWAIPNYLAQRVHGQDTSGLRIYTDFGTAESETNFQAMWSFYNKLLADGYVPNDTVRIEVGCGHAHNEPAWAERVYVPLVFLFNAREEANWVARGMVPPRLAWHAGPEGREMEWLGMAGMDDVLQRSSGAPGASWAWADVATGRVAGLPWAAQRLAEPPGAGAAAFYRVESRAAGE